MSGERAGGGTQLRRYSTGLGKSFGGGRSVRNLHIGTGRIKVDRFGGGRLVGLGHS